MVLDNYTCDSGGTKWRAGWKLLHFLIFSQFDILPGTLHLDDNMSLGLWYIFCGVDLNKLLNK